MNDRDELAALIGGLRQHEYAADGSIATDQSWADAILARWRLMPIEEEPYRLRTPQEMADMVLKQMAGESAQSDPSTG